MKHLPLAILIPLGALLIVASIGIPIGIMLIQVDHAAGADVTLIVDVALTAAIMLGATLLSWRASKMPPAAATGRSRAPRAAEPGTRVPRTEPPARGARRGSDRKRR